MNRIIPVLLLLSFFQGAYSQSISFEVINFDQVYDTNGNQLNMNGLGGLNQPQFYNVDIDNDGMLDLFVFDRNGGKTLSLIHNGSGSYSYKPAYDQIYPGRFTTWVVFKDYNGDEKPDLWFYSEDDGGISLYRNVTQVSDAHVQFELVTTNLRAYNFNDAPLDSNDLYCDRTNIPAIEDVDGDGDIDFLTLQNLGYGITLFLNNTEENGKPLDPPSFEEVDQCWGDFIEYDGSNQIEFKRDPWCYHKIYRYKKKHAGGSSLLLIDMDDDTDMDLVLGNAGLYNLNLLYNGKADYGTKADSMIAHDSLFPSNTKRAYMDKFPAAYYQDVDGDGVKDLLVAVNMFDKRSYLYRESNSILYYRNTGKNTKPVFEIQDSNFLSDVMVDHGGRTSPILRDMDGDGDADLIVATNGDWGLTEEKADYLVYYENTGSKTNPKFTLRTYDYLGLQKDSITHMAPSIGDLNGDGKPELLVGRLDGTLSLYNIIGSGASATATKVSDNSFGIQVFQSSVPFIGDVDGDGRDDLLIGSYNGNTIYLRSKARPGVADFEKVTDTLGHILPGEWVIEQQYDPNTNTVYDSLVYRTHQFSSPVLADLDGSGDPEFILGDEFGKLMFYRDIRSSGSDTFKQVASAYHNSLLKQCYEYNMGALPRPAFADLNGDGRMDMLVGTERGGFQIALGTTDCNVGIEHLAKPLRTVNVYPNPTTGELHIGTVDDILGRFEVRDLSGQQVLNGTLFDHTLSIDALSKGIYILRIQGVHATYATKVVKN